MIRMTRENMRPGVSREGCLNTGYRLCGPAGEMALLPPPVAMEPDGGAITGGRCLSVTGQVCQENKE
jgi:hypothetical protein